MYNVQCTALGTYGAAYTNAVLTCTTYCVPRIHKYHEYIKYKQDAQFFCIFVFLYFFIFSRFFAFPS